MNKSVWFCLIVLVCGRAGFSQAYHPRNEAKVMFHATVTVDSNSHYLYVYDIRNERSSKGVLSDFALSLVDSLLTASSTEIPSPRNKKWYIDGSGSLIAGSAASRFLDIPPENGLAPGESMTILFKSPGLPSIATYYAESFAPPLSEEEADSLLESGYTMEQLFPDWKTNSYKNQTVAPNTYLLNLSEPVFLDTLISFKHQCVTLGWLRNDKSREHECEETMRSKEWYKKDEVGKMRNREVNDIWIFDRDWNNGIVGVLDKRLDMAKRALAKEDSAAARRDLQIFVMEVELVNRLGEREEARSRKPEARGPKPVMSSEAYALLKYNAEYLIDRLPERQGRDRREDKRGR